MPGKLSLDAERLLVYIHGCEQAGRAVGKVHDVAAGMDPQMTEVQLLRALLELSDAGMVEPARR